MTKCMVCGKIMANQDQMGLNRLKEPEASKMALHVWEMVEMMEIWALPIQTWYNSTEAIKDRPELAEYAVMCGIHPVPAICELCWTGMCANGNDYWWNGVYLLVFDRNDGEYHERRGMYYKPEVSSRIVFIKDELTKRWEVMPR